MAKSEKIKQQITQRRKRRIRAKIFGTAAKPRLSVFRSLKHLYAQLIDDEKGVTLVFAKDAEIKDKGLKKTELAEAVGKLIAAKAIKTGISSVIFDKSSYKYHGRIKAVAEGARSGGLKF